MAKIMKVKKKARVEEDEIDLDDLDVEAEEEAEDEAPAPKAKVKAKAKVVVEEEDEEEEPEAEEEEEVEEEEEEPTDEAEEEEEEEEDAPPPKKAAPVAEAGRKWYPTNPDAVRKKMQELKARRRGFWTPVEGDNRIRVMPPWSQEGVFSKDYLQHSFWDEAGPPDDFNKTITCRKTNGRACPICELAESEGVSEWAPKQRALINIFDYAHPESGVQIWDVPGGTLDDLMGEYADSEVGDISDPKVGYDIRVHREGTKKLTKYKIKSAKKPSAIDKSILKGIKDLDAAVAAKMPDKEGFRKLTEVLRNGRRQATKRRRMLTDDDEA